MGIFTSILAQQIDRSPSSDYWYTPLGTVSKAGVTINEDQALKISAVLQGTRFICQTVAMLPRFVFRHLEDGVSREKVPKHPINKLLRFQPNPWQTSFQFVESMTARAMLRGIGLAHKIIDNNTGDISALIPLEPKKLVDIEQQGNGKLRYIFRQNDGSRRTLSQDEIFAVPGFGVNGVKGLSLVEQMRETAGLAVAAEAYGSHYFSNSAMPRVVLTTPNITTPDTRQRMKEDWNQAYGNERQHGTALLEDGTKIDILSQDNEKSQFIETRKFLIAEFSRHLDVTPHRLSDLEKSSYNNVEQMSLETVVYSLHPWVRRWEQSAYRDLLTEEDKESQHFIEWILEGLLRGDTEARAEFYSKGVNTGWLTRNEVREKENLNPIEGLDKPLQPMNQVPIGEDGEPETPEPPTPPAPQPAPAEPTNGQPEERALALAVAGAERIIRAEQKAMEKWAERKDGKNNNAWRQQVESFYRKHIDFVAKALALDDDRARAWCSSRCQSVLMLGPGHKSWAEKDRLAVHSLAMEALGQ